MNNPGLRFHIKMVNPILWFYNKKRSQWPSGFAEWRNSVGKRYAPSRVVRRCIMHGCILILIEKTVLACARQTVLCGVWCLMEVPLTPGTKPFFRKKFFVCIRCFALPGSESEGLGWVRDFHRKEGGGVLAISWNRDIFLTRCFYLFCWKIN